MEEEQEISDFINKRLERFASFQDEEYLPSPRKGSFSTSQGSSPRAFHNQHLPQRTSSTYQSDGQVYESHEAALVGYFVPANYASLDDQERVSKKGYGRSSSTVDEYYGKTQRPADMLNNLERNYKVADTSKRDYRRSASGPGGLSEGRKEWIGSPQRKQEMGFQNSASGVHNYGQTKLTDSPKRMDFHLPASEAYNYGQNEWIDSPKRRQPMEMMQNLETSRDSQLSRAQKNYDQQGWSGSPQRKEENEIRLFSPGVQNYAQKQYIGYPKIAEDQRKMMQNLEANKVVAVLKAHKYHSKEEWNGSPRRPEDTKKWYGGSASTNKDEYYDQKGLFTARSHDRHGEVAPIVQDKNGRAAGFIGYGGYGSPNEYHQSQWPYKEQSYYHQSQPELADHGHKLKAPYMDAIEAAKLHGGVVIFDYSKY